MSLVGERSVDQKWLVTKVFVIDVEMNVGAIATIYGNMRSEMSLASILPVEVGSVEAKDIGRIAYLIGKGDVFIMPDTRIQINVGDFFKGRLTGFALSRYTPAQYRIARVASMDNVEKMVCQVSKIGQAEISGLFSYLSIDEVKARKKDMAQRKLEQSLSKITPSSNVKQKIGTSSKKIKRDANLDRPRLNSEVKQEEFQNNSAAKSLKDKSAMDAKTFSMAASDSSDSEADVHDSISQPILLLDYIKFNRPQALAMRVKPKYVSGGQPNDDIPELTCSNLTPIHLMKGEVVAGLAMDANCSAASFKYISNCTLLKDLNGLKASDGTKLIFLKS